MKHPDYDIEFKPAIARFDWDQTYDVLEFVYLPQGFDQLMDLCGIPAFELMAVDRFTPYRYRWADQYSDVVYEFLKTFNFSPHNAINERLLRDEANQLIFDLSGHPRWKNEWVSANSYAIEDVVAYNGRFYQCTTANSDKNFTSSNWKSLIYRNYNWDDDRLRKFDYIRYSSKYFLAKTDNAFLEPPITDDGAVANNWLEISVTVPKFEYDADKYNEFFDLSSHPRVVGEWRRQNYFKGDLVEWEGKYYIATWAISIDRNSYYPLSGFSQPYLVQWDQTDTQQFQLDNIVLYHDGKYYMPLLENATLPLWEDKEQPPPEPDTVSWTPIDFISYKATFLEGEYQITALIYDGWQEGLTGSIPTINQAFFNFTVGTDGKEFDLNKLLLHWTSEGSLYCSCSMVISKKDAQGGWVEYSPSINSKPTWLLFDDINTYFNNVKQQLIDYFQNTFNEFINYKLDYYSTTKNYTISAYSGTSNDPIRDSITFTTRNKQTIKIPQIYPLQSYLNLSCDISANLVPNYLFQHSIDLYYGEFDAWAFPQNYTNNEDRRTFQVLLDYKESSLTCVFNLDFVKFPSFMINDCYLARANNNKWSTQQNYNDKGNLSNYSKDFSRISRYNELYSYEDAYLLEKEEIKNTLSLSPIGTISESTDFLAYTGYEFDTYYRGSYDIKNDINNVSINHDFNEPINLVSHPDLGNVSDSYLVFYRDYSGNAPFYSGIISKRVNYNRDFRSGTLGLPKNKNSINYAKNVKVSVLGTGFTIMRSSQYNPTGVTYFSREDDLIDNYYYLSSVRSYRLGTNNIFTDYSLKILGDTTGTLDFLMERPSGEWGARFTSFSQTDQSPINFTEQLLRELELFTQQEWQELYDDIGMTDQEYLDYLLQLKEQYEEMSKTW